MLFIVNMIEKEAVAELMESRDDGKYKFLTFHGLNEQYCCNKFSNEWIFTEEGIPSLDVTTFTDDTSDGNFK